MPVIDVVVNKIPDWDGKDVVITPLSGGLTNPNFKVQVMVPICSSPRTLGATRPSELNDKVNP